MDNLSFNPEPRASIEVDVAEIFGKIFKHLHVLISAVVICVVLALLNAYISMPIYKATSRIMVESKAPKVTKVEDTVLADYRDDEDSFFNSQVEVLRSHAVASIVFDELGDYVPWSLRHAKDHEAFIKLRKSDKVDILLKNVKVSPIRFTEIITINVEDPDPNLAARIAGLWTRAYILFSSTDQLVQKRSELEDDLDQQYKYYKDKHPVILGLKSQIAAINEIIEDQNKEIFSGPISNFSFSSNDFITNVKVLDDPTVPDKPDRPRKTLMVFIALVFGTVLGLGLIFVFDMLDQSIKTSKEAESFLKVPSLIAVPVYIKTNKKAKIVPELATHMDRHSFAAEAFRSLRTGILFSHPDIKKKILVVTSSVAGEGKTTLAVNLATAFAQAGERTLIIDADLRKPKLHFVFNVQRDSGVTEAISFENTDVTTFIHTTEVPNLSLLTCGAVPPNPSELLGSKRMQNLLAKLSGMYDRILLDTSPVLVATDAVVLSTKADGVIFVVKAVSTPRQMALRSLSFLSSIHAVVIGSALNMFKPTSQESNYYYNYGKSQQRSS